MEELSLPTRAIQLSGEVQSTDEAASAELREAEAAYRTRNLRCLFKAAPTMPCVCRKLLLETGERDNKHLKRTFEFDSTAAVWPSRGCSHRGAASSSSCKGWAPPGPNPNTTWRFSSARPRIALGYSHNKRNRK